MSALEIASSLAGWRNEIGLSAALWAGAGRHFVETDLWIAISGSQSLDHNVALAHGDRESVDRGLAEVTDAGRPAFLMLAGSALGRIQPLADAGWVCVGAQPLMVLPSLADQRFRGDDSVRRASASDLVAVRAIAAAAFGTSPDSAEVAFPDDLVGSGDNTAWILEDGGEGRSIVSTAIVGSAMAVWSMATLPDWRGRGYGQRLLGTSLADARARGVTHSVLLSTPAGEALYKSLGYEIVEYWQVWSRPRWALAG